ncbi:MAG: signal peptidase I [Cellulosilyticaceae bacterium]
MNNKHSSQNTTKIRKCLQRNELIKEILMAILVVMLMTEFVIAHNMVPTGSMIPTIQIGDHLVTNKLPYYYRDPKRGEVVVFTQENERLVKRVIAIPGDEIDIRDNKVWLNGEELDESEYIYIWESTWQVAGAGVKYPFTIPEGYYFVMGDNRPESLDSRYFGPIHRKQIIAKASLRIYPLSKIGEVR